MATGIVSVAAHLLEVPWVPVALFALNLGAYLLLWAITLARLLGFPAALLHDLARHAVAPSFLTTVAATSVLGVQFALLTSHLDLVALGLWGFAVQIGRVHVSTPVTNAHLVCRPLLATTNTSPSHSLDISR